MPTVICSNVLRRSLGRQWFPSYTQFRYAAPMNLEPLRKVFGEHLFFNQDVNAIHLSNEDFERPNHRNPTNSISIAGKKVVQREVESNIGESVSFVQRVDRIIRLLINDEGCCVSEVAQALDLSSRTLQYRLKTDNIIYQK